MFLTQGQVEAGYFTNNRYGTAGTTTQTTLASSGGLLVNIDSATGDIAQTGTGWIEDEKYGFYAVEFATSTSSQFKTGVITGEKVLRLELLDITGRARCNTIPASNYSTVVTNLANSAKLFPLKPSTKYKFKIKARLFLSSGTGPAAVVEFAQITSTGANTTAISGISTTASDFTYIERTFTSAADGAFLGLLINTGSAGGIGYADFQINSMTLEEVVEPVADSLTSSSPSLVSFTAVGSTDNIDQSLDTGAAYANTYTPPTSISEAATALQTFVPTKSKLTSIGVYVVAKGTGNWKLTVHNAANAVQASATIANASLTNGAFNYFNVPANLTAGGTYHFHVTSTVADGTLKCNTANDLETCSFIQNYYKPTTNFKASQNNQSVSISADEDGFLNGSVYNLTTGTATFTETFGTFYLLQYTISGSDLIAEVNLPGVGLSASFTSDRTLEYSSDGITYGSTFPTGYSKVWVKILAYSGFASFSYSIQFSTASINTLRNYPTNKDIIKQYSTTLGSATTSATYRATKWGFPAIEYSATEYQFLDVDTTATGSTVAFSELGTSYTTVADGASLAITSTSTPNIFVKANITANRLYVSSNDYNASSDKDGSLKQSVVYQVIQ